jgi:CheY-like chemotaxis protein
MICRTSQAKLNVLVVDDDPDGAETLAVLLTMYGHDVRIAHNGTEALKQAEATLPDVMLMDIRMAGIDGCEVARRIRRSCCDSRAPLLVAVTGCARDADREITKDAGFHLHLAKPVDPGILNQILSNYSRTAELALV